MEFWLHTAGLRTQIPPKNIQAPLISMNTTQIPLDNPQTTPRYPTDTPRHLQGTQHANRRQQMPTDTARHFWTLTGAVWVCLAVSIGVCCRLFACCAPRRCLGGVCGMSGGCLGVSEWYSWKSEALGYVSGVSGFSVLQYGAKTPFWHNSKRHNFFSSDHTETSKYQNRRIYAFQKWLG